MVVIILELLALGLGGFLLALAWVSAWCKDAKAALITAAAGISFIGAGFAIHNIERILLVVDSWLDGVGV